MWKLWRLSYINTCFLYYRTPLLFVSTRSDTPKKKLTLPNTRSSLSLTPYFLVADLSADSVAENHWDLCQTSQVTEYYVAFACQSEGCLQTDDVETSLL